MRLLKAANLELVEFAPDKIPRYAILSHVWGESKDEVQFADIAVAPERRSRDYEAKKEYRKIRLTCIQAMADQLDYVWIDTVCIDKSSSAELSEAINSMYAWYQRAAICYTYLVDVSAQVDVQQNESEFTKSKWFTRGWTLQELLASKKVIFFSHDWIKLGDKQALGRVIAGKTLIDEDILTEKRSLQSASIAKRMSWASKRKTTRAEDLAYCLMGVFSVNMPMLYGEGEERAFLRLQEEIMKHSDDQSIFAWVDEKTTPDALHGLLAKSPVAFFHANTIMPYQDREVREPFSISNRGLQIELHLSPVPGDNGDFVAAIDCPAPPDFEDSSFLAIYLRKLPTGNNQYARIKAGNFAKVLERGTPQTIYVRQTPVLPGPDSMNPYPHHVFQLRGGPADDQSYKVCSVETPQNKAPASLKSSRAPQSWLGSGFPHTFKITKGANHIAAAITFEREDGERLLILLGSTAGFDVAFDAIDYRDVGSRSLATYQKVFRPMKMGEFIETYYHRVKISIEIKVHELTKYYMVDIEIEGFHISLNPIHIVQDAIEIAVKKDSFPERTRKPGTSKLKRLFTKEK